MTTVPPASSRDRRRHARARTHFVLPCLALLSSAPLFGQTAPSASPDGEIVEMSPFEVVSEQDKGYMASSAQSGTRLRTDLRDIASSISVITKDFMDDIGATGLEGLLVYTMGTEVNGLGGNFSDASEEIDPNGTFMNFDGSFMSASPSTRVRGLTSADVSRDFFVSRIPTDNYNVERVEISRGPNAMLFGLGSPAGIINSSLITAKLNKNSTSMGLRVDQYGSIRASLDHNQVLVPRQLALRVSTTLEDTKYKVEEAWRETKRLFLTATYRPFRNTTIKAGVEFGDIDANAPEYRPPNDAYTYWWDMGKPAWNPSTNTGVMLGTPAEGWPAALFNATTGAALSIGGGADGLAINGETLKNSGIFLNAQMGAISGGSRQMVIVYNDPNSSLPSLGLPGSTVAGFRSGSYGGLKPATDGTFSATQMRGMRDYHYILNKWFHGDDISYGYWKMPQLTDPSIFNFYEHMLHGQNKHEWADFQAYDATIEQRFFNGKAGAELSFHRELLDNGNVNEINSGGYTLRLDVNQYLGNGEPNPNFGRPYTVAYSKASVNSYEQEGIRGTLYYDLDFRKVKRPAWLGKLLGRHRLTGTWSFLDNSSFLSQNNTSLLSGLDYYATEFPNEVVRDVTQRQRYAFAMSYLGPDVSGADSPVKGVVSVPATHKTGSLGSASILYYAQPLLANGTANIASSPTRGAWQERTFSILSAGEKDVDAVIGKAVRKREKITSLSGVLQSFWWDGMIVSTLGFRKDEVKTYDAGSVDYDPLTGLAILDEFDAVEIANQSDTSFNYGFVLHAPEKVRGWLPFGSDISLTYNHADNFKPAGQRYNIYDEKLDAETGETTEYGVLLSMFKGKLVLRAAHYETTSALSSDLVSGLRTPIANLAKMLNDYVEANLLGINDNNPAGLAAFNDWWNGPVGSKLQNTFRFRYENGTVHSDDRSGQVVATADVVSKGEEYELVCNPMPSWRISVNAARARAVRSNIAPLFSTVVLDSLMPLAEGPAGSLYFEEEPASGAARQDFNARTRAHVLNQLLPTLASDGQRVNELREWRVNAITNYTFARGFLKGWNIGGGVRWQDKVAIGNPIVYAWAPVDAANPADPANLYGRVPDVNNPYYGPAQTNFDVWVGYKRKFKKFTFSAQLNVKNIGVGDELIPVMAQPDGSIAAWRIREPQYISMRTSFNF